MIPRALISCCLLLLAVASVVAQPPSETPEQSFFDWTEIQFPKEAHQQRRQALATALAEKGGIFLTPSRDGFSSGETFRQLDDFLYLTGLELPNSLLALDAVNGTVILFAPREDARFSNPSRRNDFPGRKLALDPALTAVSGIEAIRPIDELPSAVASWVTEKRPLLVNTGRTLNLDEWAESPLHELTPAQSFLMRLESSFPEAKIESAFPEVAALRMVKGPEEVEVLRRAAQITTAGIRAAAAHVTDGIDERSLEAEFEAELKRRGAQRLAFDSIIKSGANSLWPWRILAAHYDRRNRSMRDGELVIFDVGCELDHYSSDVGRTFPVSGSFNDRQRQLVEMVRRVSDAVIAAAKPGVTLSDLQQIASSHIPDRERRYMQTGLFFGHHIGLAVGDPSLPDVELQTGMVFTVEPWYYNHNEEVAVFIEDEVLITPQGAENMTASLPRTADGLERLMNAPD